MNFHPDKQLLKVAGDRDQTTNPWITKPALYLYIMGDLLRTSAKSYATKMKDKHISIKK